MAKLLFLLDQFGKRETILFWRMKCNTFDINLSQVRLVFPNVIWFRARQICMRIIQSDSEFYNVTDSEYESVMPQTQLEKEKQQQNSRKGNT